MKIEFTIAPDIQHRLNHLIRHLSLTHIKPEQVIAFRSFRSRSRAYARIWAMPTIWQIGLKIPPHYCIEVIAGRFDSQSYEEQTRTLIHELLHIPQTFSGALRPHHSRGRIKVDRRTVEQYYRRYSDIVKQSL